MTDARKLVLKRTGKLTRLAFPVTAVFFDFFDISSSGGVSFPACRRPERRRRLASGGVYPSAAGAGAAQSAGGARCTARPVVRARWRTGPLRRRRPARAAAISDRTAPTLRARSAGTADDSSAVGAAGCRLLKHPRRAVLCAGSRRNSE